MGRGQRLTNGDFPMKLYEFAPTLSIRALALQELGVDFERNGGGVVSNTISGDDQSQRSAGPDGIERITCYKRQPRRIGI